MMRSSALMAVAMCVALASSCSAGRLLLDSSKGEDLNGYKFASDVSSGQAAV